MESTGASDASVVTDARQSEAAYDRRRLQQWLTGQARAGGVARRDMLRLVAAAGLASTVPVA
ncbi:hypothetical protein G3I23_25825, partial [Streptomyces sp. SID10115]|nr:hypothetical protein [Streptomyces sp. SID10115]